MNPHVLIIIEGGVCQAVYSDDSDVKVTLLDKDELEDDYTRSERDIITDELIGDLTEVMIYAPEGRIDAPTDNEICGGCGCHFDTEAHTQCRAESEAA